MHINPEIMYNNSNSRFNVNKQFNSLQEEKNSALDRFSSNESNNAFNN